MGKKRGRPKKEIKSEEKVETALNSEETKDTQEEKIDSKMKKCDRCGHVHSKDIKTCPECGAWW